MVTGTDVDGTITYNVTGATAGAVYYISVKYDPGSLLGQAFARPSPTVIYTHETYLNGARIAGSIDTVNVKPK